MRSRLALACGWLLAAATLSADDSPPPVGQFTVSGSYSLTAEGGQDASPWTAGQSAELAVTGRWGQTLHVEGHLTAPFDGTSVTADGLLRQLVLAWSPTPWSVVTFGKQRLKWGSARVLSAISGLEPAYDPLHPAAPLDGVAGVKAEVLPNEWLGVSLLALPAAVLDDSKFAARADVLWADTDLSFGAVAGTVQALTSWNGVAAVQQKRTQGTVFADASHFFDSFGVYAEVQASRLRDRDWYGTDGAQPLSLMTPEGAPWSLRATAGLQVDTPVWLNGTVTWLTEYRYDGAGFDAAEASSFATAWAHRTASTFSPPTGLTVGTLSKHYAYTGLSGVPVTEKLTAGASVLAGLVFLTVRDQVTVTTSAAY
jgi:hypothetical protein